MSIQTFNTNVVWSGTSLRNTANINQHSITIDEPTDLGGTDQGANPIELLLASLGGCLNVVITMLAPRYDVTINSLQTSVSGDLDINGFMEKAPVRPGLQQIRFKVDLKSNAPQDQINALIAHAQRICPVGDTLTGVPIIQE